MSGEAAFEKWCWDRTADDPRVLEFRTILAKLPEVPDRQHPSISLPRFLNGRPARPS